MLKELVEEIDFIVAQRLPLLQPMSPSIQSWAALHGWDTTDVSVQRLLLRQALLNTVLRQGVPGLDERAFTTPLDDLNVVMPSTLANRVFQAILHSTHRAFNPWGEFYNALIRQAQRRQIGQFWTEEHIAEWMAAWLLQGKPLFLRPRICLPRLTPIRTANCRSVH